MHFIVPQTMPMKALDIMSRLQHRWPFLLLDRVDTLSESGATGTKLCTINENHFSGHFPSYPIMPGVLILESCAQLAAIWAGCFTNSQEGHKSQPSVRLSGFDGVKFKKEVVPGDILKLSVINPQMRKMGNGSNIFFKCDISASLDSASVLQGSLSGFCIEAG